MGRKVLLVTRNDHEYDLYVTDPIRSLYEDWAKKYGLDIKTVMDRGLECDGGVEKEQTLRIEREGPDWVRHEEEYLKEVEDAEIIIVAGFSAVGKQLLDRAKKLKIIGSGRSGMENVDVEECHKRGILVCNAPGRLQESVSDLTCALILDVNRAVTYFERSYDPKDDNTTSHIRTPFPALLFKDMTLGLSLIHI